LTINLHYGRAGRRKSSRRLCVSRAARVFAMTFPLLAGVCASAQYPGQIKSDKDKDKEAPSLRAIAVLEWTGDLGKPKTSRLVPITVYDGEQLQDGGEYLARPEPLAVAGGVEYILQRNGAKIGLFDVRNSSQEEGSWVGFGIWKPLPKPKGPPPARMQKIDEDVETSDKPVLHRKRGSSGDSSGSGAGSGSGSGGPTLHKKSSSDDSDSDSASSAPPPDPDRPTLHKAPDSSDGASNGSANGNGSNNGNGNSSGQSPTSPSQSPSTDSKASAPASTTSSTTSDPDRPQLKRGKAKQEPDEGYVESVNAIDPSRPRLTRGKTDDTGVDIAPTLMGLPADMEQAVAVSDPRNHPDHPWSYAWADLADEGKMKAAVEDIARSALGIQTPAAPAIKKTATTRAKAKPVPPPAPAPLADEEFRVLELAYGSGATMVLTAHTEGPLAQQKFITLIAQPDLYGSAVVLFKSVTDGAHLDDKPYMRLVDAVDALADNRGELLFELRGKTGRQFALYRVLRGTATQLFVTGGGAASLETQN
jgi:hypothetical protein